MRFLHTADWHIGRQLHGRKRYDEHAQFLDWLLSEIESQKIDVLLVAGDIFDTRTPSNRAQELYYQFLARVSQTSCQHIVITSGNHDSPSFLDATKGLLRSLRIHVVGQSGEISEQLIELPDKNGEIQALIAAVPYLRDRDIRKVEIGESLDEKEQKIVAGIRAHYHELAELAQKKLSSLSKKIPVIAMGHLFASGGQIGDGVRDLYIGNLGSISAETFSEIFDYVALGHLHVAQKVGGKTHIRYSGSPIPMGFGEASHEKKVLIFETKTEENSEIGPQALAVPDFQKLLRLSGDLDELLAEINELKAQKSSAWLEIRYAGLQSEANLRPRLYEAVAESEIEILRLIDETQMRTLESQNEAEPEQLDSLSEMEVFERCLSAHDVQPEERAELCHSFQEILQIQREADLFAE